MRDIIFEGVATAIITPFNLDGFIDYDTLEELIEFQIKNKAKAIVVAGTTGESATLTDEEHFSLIKFVVNAVAGRVPVIAGAGSNNTSHARILCRNSKRAGADAILAVTPYYNKCNIDGLYNHYKMCSEETDNTLPIIVYNVPSRTGVNIKPDDYKRLLDIESIVAVKEASGNVSIATEIIARYGDTISVYSGNDDLTIPILSVGGKGVISVASNIIPWEMSEICDGYLGGKTEYARNTMLHYLELINAMFIDVNPIPVKDALKIMGYGTGKVRLPLVELDCKKRDTMDKLVKKYHLRNI